jgi:Amt family ammonium transporter
MGALAWVTVAWAHKGHPSVLGAAAGAVAGLVAITPAAGFVDAPASVLIGMGAGVFCFFAVDILKRNVGVDDALDVFAVHGVGGIWGALATGLFATTAVNSAGADGLFYGNPTQLLKQAVAVAAVALFTAAVTWIILKVVDVTVGLRVPEQEEVLGLDTTTHGEVAYQL